MSFLNTYQSGTVRSIIYKENGEWFGVALEFNIVETGDSPQEVMILLDNAIKGYVEAATKSKLSVSVLNQDVNPEYESLWEAGSKNLEQGSRQIYSASTYPLATLVA